MRIHSRFILSMSSFPPRVAQVLTEGETDYEETTLRGYRSSWRDLMEWAEDHPQMTIDHREEALPPPASIASFLEDRTDLAWSTLKTRRQAIRLVYHELEEIDPFELPEVEKVWSRIVAEKRNTPTQSEKRSLTERDLTPANVIENGPNLLHAQLPPEITEKKRRVELQYLPQETANPESLSAEVRELIPAPEFDLAVLRDRAVLLLGAMTDLPRKDLLGIDMGDLYPPEHPDDSTKLVIHSDGDPIFALELETGSELRYCPNRALAAWILAADLTGGPLFRPFTPHGGVRDGRIQPQTLNLIIKRRAKAAGLNPDNWSTTKLRKGD